MTIIAEVVDMFRMMVLCALLAGSVGADDPQVPVQTSPALAIYQSAQNKAGHDAEAHVRLALWCEEHGLSSERLKHLSLAVVYDPANTLARGLLGLVGHHGKWDRPEVVGREIRDDPAHQAVVKEYLDRRARTPEKAEAQMKLAAWCEEKGLKEQALAHFNLVTRLDPSREAAWKHLGYKKQGNHWVKPEEAAAARQEAMHQKVADKHWKSKLEKLRDGLESKDHARRAKAEQGLSEVTDPRAVPMIWALFVRGSERPQIAAVQMLGQIDGPSASNGLTVLAVFSPSAEVRRRATETLKRRDPRDVVGKLIGLIHQPYTYEVRHPNGPGSPGELFVEGERFNIQRFYQNRTPAPAVAQGRMFTPDVPFDPFSVRNITMATMTGVTTDAAGSNLTVTGKPGYSVTFPLPLSTQSAARAGQAIAGDPRTALAVLHHLITNPADRQHGPAMGVMIDAEKPASRQDIVIANQLEAIREAEQDLAQRLAMDIHFLDATNENISLFNERALPVLKAITGQDLGVNPEKWKSWWTDQLGYAYEPDRPETKPTFTDFVAEAVLVPSYVHAACFAAGTPVQTIDGPRAIETIRIGDRVLSQGTKTGQLGFEAVVATHRNPPAPTLRIDIGGETIVATGIHRFWKAGQGWTMARELKTGDRLRIVGGTAAIKSIDADKNQPVFNLEVAENADFFVGSPGVLVHDFGFVQPVLEPFDRRPELATLATSPP